MATLYGDRSSERDDDSERSSESAGGNSSSEHSARQQGTKRHNTPSRATFADALISI